jgi:pimeloyl-ACP methyl ester carboxylesterase
MASQLARWLGPWADRDATPGDVMRQTEVLDPSDGDGGTVRAHRYEPRDGAVTGTYLVVHGLHYLGPDDPRLDRFCRVLASAGFCVVAPFVRDFLELRVAPRAADDVAAATDYAVRLSAQRGLPRPALFSISFGSTPAIEVAASERHRDAIGALVLFGGFFDFHATIRFAVTTRAFAGALSIDVPHDPLNAPAVFINLIEHLENGPARDELRAAWLEMVRRTWGRLELRPRARRLPIAEQIAATLAPERRPLFLIGCGLAPGGAALLELGLARAGDYFAFTDPASRLARVTAPVVISHGRDDDVVPYLEAGKLRDALPGDHPHRLHITGMYGHTHSALPSPAAFFDEAGTLLSTLYSLVDAPHEAIGA